MTSAAIDINLGLIRGQIRPAMLYVLPVRRRQPRPRPSFLRLWQAASGLTAEQWDAGRRWYPRAIFHLEDAATAFDHPYERIAYAAATLSPGLSWRATIETLDMLLRAHRDGRPMPLVGHQTYGTRDRVKAWRILSGEPPRRLCQGRKVQAFAAALMGADEPVVDRHIVRIATGSDIAQVGGTAMGRIAASLATIAWAKGERTTSLQAALWSVKTLAEPGAVAGPR